MLQKVSLGVIFNKNLLSKCCQNFAKSKVLVLSSTILSVHISIASVSMQKTAGIIIIGDEILKGQTQDINSFHLCKTLHDNGVQVKQVSVIGDELSVIASKVSKFSNAYDLVLTSGGIGPTHDDLTFEGVAKAFSESLIPHPTLVELCKKYFGAKDLSSPEMKLAKVPKSSKLHFGIDTVKGESLKFPLVSVNNVYIFPGIPVLLRRLVDGLAHIFSSNVTFYEDKLLINSHETEIAKVLTDCSEKFKDTGLTVGSYPDWFNNYYKVKVVVESANKDATNAAVNFLKQNLPQESILTNYVEQPVTLKGQDVFGDTITAKNSLLHQKMLHSIGILEDAFERYPSDSIYIGFNGGKDCTALLHLYYAVICRKYPDSNRKLHAIYIRDKYPFEELENFMTESVSRYNLHLITLNGSMKEALQQLHDERPDVKAVVMGTRCTDPYSRNLTAFTPTDSGWPQFMRVNPILNWTYHDIWVFLRTLYLPYCVLYDRGYTSLGSREKTHRNDKLVTTNESGQVRYAPAYTLKDQDFERNGRL